MEHSDFTMFKRIINKSQEYVTQCKLLLHYYFKGDNIDRKLYKSKEVPLNNRTVFLYLIYKYDGILNDKTKENILSEFREVNEFIKTHMGHNSVFKFRIYGDDEKLDEVPMLPKNLLPKGPNNYIITIKYHINAGVDAYDFEDWGTND